MFIREEILHYIVQFLERYDIQTGTHPKAIKEVRQISNELIEDRSGKPRTINVIRHEK